MPVVSFLSITTVGCTKDVRLLEPVMAKSGARSEWITVAITLEAKDTGDIAVQIVQLT